MRTAVESGRALHQARQEMDSLFRLVRPDSIYDRPIGERHRIIFYLGHVDAFDWNLIARYALDVPAFHESFDRLFAFGIDPPPGELPGDQPADWPSVAEVEGYQQRTRAIINELIGEVPEQLLHVAIEHRLMHAETFTYILHQLPYGKKTGLAPHAPIASRPPAGRKWVEIPEGEACLGLAPGEGFGWDNEFRGHMVHVPGFAIGRYKVTNREYLEYVDQGAPAPFFWVWRGGEWFYRGMFSEYPLPLD